MLVLAMEFSRCGCRRRGCRRAAAWPAQMRAEAEGAAHARALRPMAAARPARVAPSKRNRRSQASRWRTVGGKHLRRPCGPEARIISGQLGAPWRMPMQETAAAPGEAP